MLKHYLKIHRGCLIRSNKAYPSRPHERARNFGICCSPSLVFCVDLLCVFMFRVSCCDVRYDFRIKTMFGSTLLPLFVRGLMSYLRYFCLFAYSGVQHILCCAFVLFVFVLWTLCCQFPWIVHL
jgi:hypothetical protein